MSCPICMQRVLCSGLETSKEKGRGTFCSDSRGGPGDAPLKTHKESLLFSWEGSRETLEPHHVPKGAPRELERDAGQRPGVPGKGGISSHSQNWGLIHKSQTELKCTSPTSGAVPLLPPRIRCCQYNWVHLDAGPQLLIKTSISFFVSLVRRVLAPFLLVVSPCTQTQS